MQTLNRAWAANSSCCSGPLASDWPAWRTAAQLLLAAAVGSRAQDADLLPAWLATAALHRPVTWARACGWAACPTRLCAPHQPAFRSRAGLRTSTWAACQQLASRAGPWAPARPLVPRQPSWPTQQLALSAASSARAPRAASSARAPRAAGSGYITVSQLTSTILKDILDRPRLVQPLNYLAMIYHRCACKFETIKIYKFQIVHPN